MARNAWKAPRDWEFASDPARFAVIVVGVSKLARGNYFRPQNVLIGRTVLAMSTSA
jgi:hypothetical protein